MINRVRSYALPTVRYSHSPKPASLAYASFRFPDTWPVYTPALKLAGWLEFYADVLELNIWTSSTITSIRQDPQTSKWDVEIKRGDGTERKFTVNHVVFCTGLGSGVPNTPTYPGMVSIFRFQSFRSCLSLDIGQVQGPNTALRGTQARSRSCGEESGSGGCLHFRFDIYVFLQPSSA